MKNIEWTQVLLAFFLGVVLSAIVKGLFSQLKNKAGGLAGG